MLTFVAILVHRSVLMLIECGIKAQKYDFEDVAGHYLGNTGYYAVLLFMWVFSYGAMVAYLVIVGDTIPVVLQLLFNASSPNRNLITILLSVAVVLPLCLLRDLSSLSWTSMLSVIADTLLIIIIVVASPIEANIEHIKPNIDFVNSSLFAGVGTISFAFVCQHNSFLMFKSLEVQTYANWSIVASLSVGFSYFLCLIFGLSGYLSFAESTKGDLLTNFPDSNVPVNISRLLLGITMLFTYPMECYVSRHCFQSIILRFKRRQRKAIAESLPRTTDNNTIHESNLNQEHRVGNKQLTHFSAASSSLYNPIHTGSPAPSNAAPPLPREHGTPDSSCRLRAGDESTVGNPGRHSSNGHMLEWEGNDTDADDRDIETVDFGTTNHSQTLDNRGQQNTSNSNNPSTVAEISFWEHAAISIGLWGSSLYLAVSFTDLGVVLGLTGALGASFLGFVLPALIYIQTYRKEFREACRVAFHWSKYESNNQQTAMWSDECTSDALLKAPSVEIPTIESSEATNNTADSSGDLEDRDGRLSPHRRKNNQLEYKSILLAPDVSAPVNAINSGDDDDLEEVVDFDGSVPHGSRSVGVTGQSSHRLSLNRLTTNSCPCLGTVTDEKSSFRRWSATIWTRVTALKQFYLPLFMIAFGLIAAVSGVGTILYQLSY